MNWFYLKKFSDWFFLMSADQRDDAFVVGVIHFVIDSCAIKLCLMLYVRASLEIISLPILHIFNVRSPDSIDSLLILKRVPIFSTEYRIRSGFDRDQPSPAQPFHSLQGCSQNTRNKPLGDRNTMPP